LSWEHLSVGFITEFDNNDSYETLICELSQIKQGVLDKAKDYTDRVQELSVRITRSLHAQGHSAENPIFEEIKALVVKHFMIGMLPELLQQVKYEGVDTLKDVICITEKKKASLESTRIISPKDVTNIHPTSLRASSSTSMLHPSNMPSRMEAAMEQLVSQMTQLSVHLLQPRFFCNSKRGSNKV
jgi:hypothetical protein